MDNTKPTDKQIAYVNRIIKHLGFETVESYIQHHRPGTDMNALTKDQAQKIITGLDHRMPKKPIRGVAPFYP